MVSETELNKISSKPRVTMEDINASIADEYYFNAGEILGLKDSPLNNKTFCLLVLSNGFTVTGESACVYPENYNKEIGERIAKEKAIDNIWPLLGFRLMDKLTQEEN